MPRSEQINPIELPDMPHGGPKPSHGQIEPDDGDAFRNAAVQSEFSWRDDRIKELEQRVRDWQRWYEDVATDFIGLTTDRNDPDKLHDWEWMDDYRPAPGRMQFDMLGE